MKKNLTTPQTVVDAIQVIAAYMRENEIAQTLIGPTGKTSFLDVAMVESIVQMYQAVREREAEPRWVEP